MFLVKDAQVGKAKSPVFYFLPSFLPGSQAVGPDVLLGVLARAEQETVVLSEAGKWLL